MANVRVLRRAEAELEEAVAWYQSRDPRTARRFKVAVAAALGRIASLPELYALEDANLRLCPIAKSRYVIVYEYDSAANEVVVISLANPTQEAPEW